MEEVEFSGGMLPLESIPSGMCTPKQIMEH